MSDDGTMSLCYTEPEESLSDSSGSCDPSRDSAIGAGTLSAPVAPAPVLPVSRRRVRARLHASAQPASSPAGCTGAPVVLSAFVEGMLAARNIVNSQPAPGSQPAPSVPRNTNVRAPANSKHRAFVFTTNNYSDADQQRLRDLAADPGVRYVVFGRERGESGTPHLQGFVYFKNPRAFAATSRVLGGHSHVEPAYGTNSQAADYCKKDGDFEVWDRVILLFLWITCF